MMNNRPGAAGRGGGAGRGGLERKIVYKTKPAKKSATYTSDTEAIKNDIFDCSNPEHAASLKRFLKQVADYIRREGDKESILVADGLESFTMPIITVPPRPPRIEDPNNPGVMIEDRGAMIMWEGKL